MISFFGAADLDKFVAFVGSFAWWVFLSLSFRLSSLPTRKSPEREAGFESDKLTLLIGCSIPLCYIYPAMLHLRACARTRRERFLDYVMIAFGSLVAVYMTVQTIRVRLPFPLYRAL